LQASLLRFGRAVSGESGIGRRNPYAPKIERKSKSPSAHAPSGTAAPARTVNALTRKAVRQIEQLVARSLSPMKSVSWACHLLPSRYVTSPIECRSRKVARTPFQSSAKFREPRLPKFMIRSLLTKLCPPDVFSRRFIKTRERRPLRQRRASAANALTLLMRAARRQGMVWAVDNPVW
jgi:hypothetical protein